ncbi:MAG: hypothetical protein ABIQ04_04510 [Candidatus Saccharimonadales bacterium]
MKITFKKLAQSLLLVPVIALGVSLALPAFAPTTANAAFNGGIENGASEAKGTGQQNNLDGTDGVFKTVTNVMLYIIGAVSVIMLIIGGIRYVVSGGESSAVSGAKNTILYAVIGIIVALIAYALVNFVITSFKQ